MNATPPQPATLIRWAAVGAAFALIGVAHAAITSVARGSDFGYVRAGRDYRARDGEDSLAVRDGGTGPDSGTHIEGRPATGIRRR